MPMIIGHTWPWLSVTRAVVKLLEILDTMLIALNELPLALLCLSKAENRNRFNTRAPPYFNIFTNAFVNLVLFLMSYHLLMMQPNYLHLILLVNLNINLAWLKMANI